MLAEGLWSRARKRKEHRERREGLEHFGELVQMDGSFHKWSEQRGPEGCLMNLVDDATGTTLGRLGAQETIWAAGVLRGWIEKYGVPVALYTDWKNVYVREATEKELLRDEVPVTQFGRMWDATGPAGEETATQEDPKLRGRQRVPGDRVSGRVRSTVRASGCSRGGLLPAPAEPDRTGCCIPPGDWAHHRPRLRGASWEPILPSKKA